MIKGSSVNTYARPEDELGTAHFDFKIAHKGGEPCPVCGCTIERVLIQNRGSYFTLNANLSTMSTQHKGWQRLEWNPRVRAY